MKPTVVQSMRPRWGNLRSKKGVKIPLYVSIHLYVLKQGPCTCIGRWGWLRLTYFACQVCPSPFVGTEGDKLIIPPFCFFGAPFEEMAPVPGKGESGDKGSMA